MESKHGSVLKIDRYLEGVIDEEERNKTIGVHMIGDKKIIFVKENGKVYFTTVHNKDKLWKEQK